MLHGKFRAVLINYPDRLEKNSLFSTLVNDIKQILQNLKSGETEVADVPSLDKPGNLLIATKCSLISSGTERTLVEFNQSNLLLKATTAKLMVLDKIKTDGLHPTIETVKQK